MIEERNKSAEDVAYEYVVEILHELSPYQILDVLGDLGTQLVVTDSLSSDLAEKIQDVCNLMKKQMGDYDQNLIIDENYREKRNQIIKEFQSFYSSRGGDGFVKRISFLMALVEETYMGNRDPIFKFRSEETIDSLLQVIRGQVILKHFSNMRELGIEGYSRIE